MAVVQLGAPLCMINLFHAFVRKNGGGYKVLMRRCGENTWGNKIHVKLVKQTVVGVVGGFLFVFGI